MAAKFTDKLTQVALDDALTAYASALEKQKEIEKARTALQTELLDIETKLERNGQPFTGVTLTTADEIDAALQGQEDSRIELERQLEFAKRKLRLIVSVRDKANSDIPLAAARVKESRATVAAAFERHALSEPQVKKAFEVLAEVKATWIEALRGYHDENLWAADVLGELVPTEKQCRTARILLRIEDE